MRKGKERKASWDDIYSGWKSTAKPSEMVNVRMLAPVRLPNESSWRLRKNNVIAIANSGNEVPIAIMVNPIKNSGT